MKKSQTIEELLAALTENVPAEELLAADISSSLSNAIVRHRVSLGLTQRELAEKIGMSQSTISKWENGDMNFTIDTLADIAVKLGMSLTVELKSPVQIQKKDGYRTISREKVIDIRQYQKHCSFTDSKGFAELKEM